MLIGFVIINLFDAGMITTYQKTKTRWAAASEEPWNFWITNLVVTTVGMFLLARGLHIVREVRAHQAPGNG